MIEKITTQLTGMPYGIISRDNFVHMQEIAEEGFRSICGTLETDLDKDEILDQLIANLYAWGSDLGLAGPTLSSNMLVEVPLPHVRQGYRMQ